MNFYPKKPTKINRITWVVERLGEIDRLFYWLPGTKLSFEDKGEGINRNFKDSSKSNVEKHFKKVFGYGTFIDPKGTGKAVIKSEINARHDGRIVKLPYPLEKGEICQKFIDTGLLEYRAVIVGGKVGCWIKKDKTELFSNRNCVFTTLQAESYATIEERAKIAEFCTSIGLDYGEIDVLRDEKMYIIDVNHCPGGLNRMFLKQPEKQKDIFLNAHKELWG